MKNKLDWHKDIALMQFMCALKAEEPINEPLYHPKQHINQPKNWMFEEWYTNALHHGEGEEMKCKQCGTKDCSYWEERGEWYCWHCKDDIITDEFIEGGE